MFGRGLQRAGSTLARHFAGALIQAHRRGPKAGRPQREPQQWVYSIPERDFRIDAARADWIGSLGAPNDGRSQVLRDLSLRPP